VSIEIRLSLPLVIRVAGALTLARDFPKVLSQSDAKATLQAILDDLQEIVAEQIIRAQPVTPEPGPAHDPGSHITLIEQDGQSNLVVYYTDGAQLILASREALVHTPIEEINSWISALYARWRRDRELSGGREH